MTLILSGTNGLSDVDGSAATPAIRGTDSNSGVFFPSADTVCISTNGTERARVDSSGNLGIGTSSPSGKLHVSGQTRIADSSNAANYVLIGSGANAPRGGNALTAQTSSLVFATETANPMIFVTNATEAARIDSSGNLLVGQTSYSTSTNGIAISAVGTETTNTPRLSISGASSTNSFTGFSIYSTGAAANRFYVGYGGTVYATSTTITGISDQRLKENIRDLDEGLDTVMALKPRKFDWKEGKGADIKNARGFIAQEFEQVLPDMIEQWLDPAPEGEEPYKAVNANLIPTLVKAIQEQQAIITQLQADVAALKG